MSIFTKPSVPYTAVGRIKKIIMKRGFFYFAAVLLCTAVSAPVDCAAQFRTDEEIMSDIMEHPYRAAACHSPYYAPNVAYTPVPRGYKAIYVSHLGRHGSRYQTNGADVYDGILSLLDSLHSVKALTPEGDSLRIEIRHMSQSHNGMDGMLTRKGAAEHTGIAERLAERCPSVFRQKDRRIVNCSSTTSQRTIQSMSGFVAGLASECGDGLDFRIGAGIDLIDYRRPEDKPAYGVSRDSLVSAVQNSLSAGFDFDALRSRLFPGYRASVAELYDLFKASSSAGCLDIDVDPLRFFTVDELFTFFKMRDVEFSAKYGTLAPLRPETAKNGKAYLRLIVSDADKALDGNGHCADLRFAHDGNVGPTMNLLGIGGYMESAHIEAPYRDWQSYAQICMASNLQLEFYRNSRSDILVKALFNEREITFPGLEPVNGVYYKWRDVRRYMIGKCEDLREVPDYYAAYIDTKAEEIRALQKDEIDGFYFITDMHFPDNYGNSAALIERLENMTERRVIIFGGDVLTYVDDIEKDMAMQISALQQMRGVSPVLWARGNHDIVNYTGKREWIKGERKAFPSWESEKLLGYFRPVAAVSNPSDPYTSYFYYDSPGRKLRYVVFDTTDSVQDDNMQSGISETQLNWIFEKAVLGAPKGYGIVFAGHVPFLGEKGVSPARDALSAFSTHSLYESGGRTYDFPARPDVNMVCVICGHRHNDYSYEFPGGQPQINVEADCNYESMKRTKETIEEQSFDYVSISKDGKVRTVRIGKGEDRLF